MWPVVIISSHMPHIRKFCAAQTPVSAQMHEILRPLSDTMWTVLCITHQASRSTLNYSVSCPLNPPLLRTNPALFEKYLWIKSFIRKDGAVVRVSEGG